MTREQVRMMLPEGTDAGVVTRLLNALHVEIRPHKEAEEQAMAREQAMRVFLRGERTPPGMEWTAFIRRGRMCRCCPKAICGRKDRRWNQ